MVTMTRFNPNSPTLYELHSVVALIVVVAIVVELDETWRLILCLVRLG